MSRLKLITRYFVRNALEEMFSSSKLNPVFVVILMLFVICMMSLPFTIMVGKSYGAFHSMGQEGVLLAFILSLGAALAFFFGIYIIMNVFYFADDIEVILPLPFKGNEIVFGKFIAVLINMYIYVGMLVLPLIAYGVASKANFIYYLYGIIALISIPILPMILASIICMLLMRFTSLTKHKDAFRMFTGCLSLVLIVGFNYFNSYSGRNMSSQQLIENFSKGNNNTMDMMTGIFITNKFLSYGLLYNKDFRGFLYIVLALLLSLLLFIIYYIVGGKLYLKGIIGISEAYSKRVNILETGDTNKLTQISSPLMALIKKDIKVILRTPQFFINCVAMILYMPAIMGMGFVSNGSLLGYAALLSKGTSWYGMAIVIAFIAGTTCVMTGGASTTALSREGKDFIVSKYIPVHYKIQLYSKIISSLIINEIGMLIVAVILILVKASLILFILGAIVAFGSILLITLFGLYIDFRSPKLEWENEKAMFKKNYMPLLVMLIVFLIGTFLVITAVIIKNFMIIFAICIGTVALGSYILYNLLTKLAYKIYNEG